ncbi:hypothetical protein JDV02_001784 [Purpureocillium takamizusanense]|uniref:Uncharacterized protein n=1 Tax=Purpureocillium takamizusanense TaxID=2060973 RepID=A0A9Q8V870_9HYPO|nr:uncharacterized protein JDV02_001784 [Purpureocillium takamizusanense]UNI15231.1 hypothetical protein JDV02_001784 [Purpureocillium takamizusanense]
MSPLCPRHPGLLLVRGAKAKRLYKVCEAYMLSPLRPKGQIGRTTHTTGSDKDASPDASGAVRVHVDGRVKNPIPSRLQHIAKKDSGNFSIMHIGVSGTMSEDPDAAARRTSERTAAQARQASQGGWQPPKRSRAAWHTDGPDITNSRLSWQTPAPDATPTPRPQQQPLFTGLPPQEAKSEQARLLTLLRTLHPLLVVDQLCKALAYFGGIPGAPPPADGVFPQSATKNGSGSLLVGWISEIFPHVENPGSIAPPLQLPPRSSAPDAPNWGNVVPSGATPGKRPRGRPKGSKSSKARKDKGIKKSRPAAIQSAGGPQPAAGGDRDEIIDATLTTTAAGAAPEQLQPVVIHAETSAPNLPASSLDPDSSTLSTPSGKKRGRPKGSKNRPKNKPDAPQEPSDQQSAEPPAPANRDTNTAPPTSGADPSLSALSSGGIGSGSAPANSASNNGALRPDPSSTRATVSFVPGSQIQSQPHLHHAQPPVPSEMPPQTGDSRGTKKRAAESNDQVSTAAKGHQNEPSEKPEKPEKAPKPKRRRVTKDVESSLAIGVAQATEPDMGTTRPVSQSFTNESTTQPTSRSLDSQDSIDDGQPILRAGPSLGSPQNHPPQRQRQHQQIQKQQFAPQKPNVSPTLTGTERRARPPIQTPSPQTRDTTTALYGLQAHSGMSPQMLYAQQQREEHLRQPQQQQQHHQQPQKPQQPQTTAPHRTNANMAHEKTTDRHPQYRQNMAAQASFGSAVPGSSQQRNMGAGRGQRQGPPQQPVVRQPHGVANQNRPQLQQQLGEMNSFASYGEQSFLNMDYGLTERDLQDAEAVMGRHDG